MEQPAAPSPFAATSPISSSRSPSKFAVGALIAGRYRLTRYLARGGMAEVWLATHESLKSEVAIKFIDQHVAQGHAGALERFRFEAQVSARLSARTRHVVAVHDAGEHEGTAYLVMEFVPGRTLERELEEHGPLDPARLAELLDQAADALSVAHDLGIVHRDLKPSNLMLLDEPDGSTSLKISDFGIAKALRGDMPLDRPKETRAGEMIGSPAYMSPEQIDGLKELDVRSDLWSLGVLAYEALTGQSCFDGRSMTELLVSISTLRYAPPSRLRPDLPKSVDAWFARALAAKPSDRFNSATEMARAFRATIERPRREQRAPWIIAMAALLLLSTAVTLVVLRLRKGELRESAAPPAPANGASAAPTASAVASPPPSPPPSLPPSVEPAPTPSLSASLGSPAASQAPHARPTATVRSQPPRRDVDESEKQ